MKLTLNATCQERKTLAGAISAALNAPTKYLGAPTFAYEIGGYRIDKAGTVTGADNEELVAALFGQGFSGETEYDGSRPNDVPARDETKTLTIEMPMAGFTPEKLDNLMKLVAAKAPLLKAALGTDSLPIQQDGGKLRFP
jgi:hypothetical protein